MGVGKELSQSITGHLDHAIIEIHDFRNSKKKDPEAQKNGTKFALENGGTAYSENFPTRVYKVRFNPSQLLMDCSSKTAVIKNVQGKKDGTVQSVNIPSLTLSLQLYFDDMFTYDAFLWDRFNSPKGLTMLAAEKGIRKDKPFSIQQDVESFIAALRNPYTRCVTFRWADFTFHGQLNFIKAQYTMFSPSGRPVRAVLSMRIKSEMDSSALTDFYESFASMFPGDGSAKFLDGFADSVGGALNVNL